MTMTITMAMTMTIMPTCGDRRERCACTMRRWQLYAMPMRMDETYAGKRSIVVAHGRGERA